MAVRKINRSDWQSFFDTFSKKFLKDDQPEYAGIQILSEDIGAQPETGWLPLEGITYNPKDDLLDIRVEQLDRMILHPSEIYVDEDSQGWITSLEIVEKDGTKDIIEIR
ncbi:MAG: DUF5335 family protein [Balneolaceae bacterium]|nr:DUF5335 family protein [Balneolaceae bacterium]